jgi:SAM-dependent methyltransferase
MQPSKRLVHDFWNDASCGEDLYLQEANSTGYAAHALTRYQLEPYIPAFARFAESTGKRVLEIGVGLGADHQQFAAAGAELHGIDLTERAVEHTRRRLAAFDLTSDIRLGDAENIEHPSGAFDLVYSWGVIHHSPNTRQAVAEIYRVLKPGGRARVMIYHKWSLVGLMLWTRYALLRLRPWRSLSSIYATYLESPGTKAYSVGEARELFGAFKSVEIRTVLTHGDLLESNAGQRHRGALLSFARRIWPRAILRKLCPTLGLFMLIEGEK